MRLVWTLAATLALTACGGGDDSAGSDIDPNDMTPPSRVAMDAFVPTRIGGLDVVSVSATTGNKSVTLDNLPDIKLIAVAEDLESGISRLEITGGTTVVCDGPGDLSDTKQALHSKPSIGGEEPTFSREVEYTIELGKQRPDDTEFLGTCPPNSTLSSITGSFRALAKNGATSNDGGGLPANTGSFSFSWSRPS